MEIFISAGESSSDIHCAKLVQELRARLGSDISFFGLGGERMKEAGVDLLMHNREFSVMGGPLEVIGKLPKRRNLEKMLEARLLEKRPSGAILCDNGEINLRLAALLHFFGIPVVYFIPPKVWVWRHSRIEKIAQHVNLVLSILPFEKDMYQAWEVPFAYVGNPLADELPMDLDASKAKEMLQLDAGKDYIAVFPGSRHSELKHHVKLFADSIRAFYEKLGSQQKPEILVPVAPSMDDYFVQKAFAAQLDPDKFKVHVFKTVPNSEFAASHIVLRASRAAIIKSGTSTLEAAVLGVPMVLSYKSSPITEWMFRNIARYRGFIGMVNLFLVEPSEAALGWADEPAKPVVPELILKNCSPEIIAREFFDVYVDGAKRSAQLEQFARARKLIMPPAELGQSPTQAAATEIAKLFTEKNRKRIA